MKTILVIILLAVGITANAQITASIGPGRSQPNPAKLYPPQHNHPLTPLLFEDFENPAGYDVAGWGEFISGTGIVNEDYTATVLYGTQSLLVQNDPSDNPNYTTNSFAATGRIWVAFRFRISGIPTADMTIFEVWDASNNNLARVSSNSDGQLGIHIPGGDPALRMSDSMVAATTYTLWLEYNKDNGANSYASVAISTDGVRPTSGSKFIDDTATISAVNASRIMLGQEQAAVSPAIGVIFDHLLVDDEQINNWP